MIQKNSPAFSIGILAGGKSSRMGQNKALMEFNNETMISRISKEFSDFGEVLVSASQKGIYETEGVRVVYDEHDSIGPIEGIRRLVSEAENEYVFICAADMPFVSSDIANYIAEFISSDYDCYVVCDEERVHPLLAIYSKKVLPVIEELIREGKYRLVEILNRVRTKRIDLSHTNFDKKVVRNVNTRDEFLQCLLPVVFTVSGYSDSGKTWLIEKLINSFILSGFKVGVIKHDGQDHIKDVPGTDTFRYSEAGADYTAICSDTRFVLSGKQAETRNLGDSGAEEKNLREAGAGAKILRADEAGAIELRSTEVGAEVSRAGEYPVKWLVKEMENLPAPPDIIILEGFKHSSYPKVEIVRGSKSRALVNPENLICISTDILSPNDVDCPIYETDDIQGIFSCILDYFGLTPYMS